MKIEAKPTVGGGIEIRAEDGDVWGTCALAPNVMNHFGGPDAPKLVARVVREIGQMFTIMDRRKSRALPEIGDLICLRDQPETECTADEVDSDAVTVNGRPWGEWEYVP